MRINAACSESTNLRLPCRTALRGTAATVRQGGLGSLWPGPSLFRKCGRGQINASLGLCSSDLTPHSRLTTFYYPKLAQTLSGVCA